MAWFNPPLYKFGNKKCPTCGNPVKWKRLFFTSVWAEWRCPKCQSALGRDLGRRVVGVILIGIVLAVATTFGNLLEPLWTVILGSVIFLICAGWWLDSVVLDRPAQTESKPPVQT